ncbi:G kinase-anchoring protein 1-like [Haliotis rubra]|uniref:G kinase-anchoring protein 1-like n=1 Tax=Haliotis rubra TaxID=36100 RepID=UPI001EE5B49B|nr:G kinase-anchoring protein 1-like [Haliotis rubra]
MAKSISVAQSRFSVLSIDDCGDDDRKSSKKQQAKPNEQPSQPKKKKNKSKQKQETSELKQLAFGTRQPRQHKDSSSEQNKKQKSGGQQNKPEQWEEWRQKDEEFAKDVYEKDLEQALLQSKVDFELEKQRKVENGATVGSNGFLTDSKEGKRSKKKKDKPHTMSLEEFNQRANAPLDDVDDLDNIPVPRVPAVAMGEGDAKFFDKVENDVHRIIQKEKIQEEYKKHYVRESAMTTKYQEELSNKDKEILELKAQVETLQEEFKQVKKRNKQLCVILAQGEMKDKAQVLMQLEDLTQVRDELTEQVSQLTAELEKEKSKVHGLKSELDKVKGGKHYSGK